jgi:hypothetical protein
VRLISSVPTGLLSVERQDKICVASIATRPCKKCESLL